MTTSTLISTAAATKTKRRVLLVDDHPLFRRGLASLVDEQPDMKVCGQVSSAPQCLEFLRGNEADAAVLDVSLPGANGLELLKYVRAEHAKLPVLVLSAHDEQTYALRCLRAGASGYLMKTETAENFASALRKVLDGGVYVSSAFGEQLIYQVARSEGDGGASPLEALTDRELEILQHVGQGRSSREIGETLHLSVKTVESHRLHIKEKLGLGDATKLVRFATEWVAQQAAR